MKKWMMVLMFIIAIALIATACTSNNTIADMVTGDAVIDHNHDHNVESSAQYDHNVESSGQQSQEINVPVSVADEQPDHSTCN